ncbi:type II toxin-antitoxin system HicB family antitoxin [Pseudomonas aeruginosa]|uniref:type II toxin-antitoxin system HicB family antitoxin n=1 Tax=Pseudomonas aeruginosa TaxID=287 RepID=UPI0009A25E11|nr:type II toxin-antitoxin system HicB family antitoxin [Pseudomonas aeruginosa]TEC93849.1 type II toxin-antitoxin system HicB family antitoxin [Pseudomonas aeruginosa]
MAKTLEYKGFQGSVDFEAETDVMYGKILHINDLVTYEADSLKELRLAFEEAVDDYIDTCKMLGVEPEKPFSGSFNIRIGAQLHKDLAKFAARKDSSINEVIKEAVNCHINGRHNEIHHHHYAQSEFEYEDFLSVSRPTRPQLTVVK